MSLPVVFKHACSDLVGMQLGGVDDVMVGSCFTDDIIITL